MPDAATVAVLERIVQVMDRVADRLLDSIDSVRQEQAELRDEVLALSNRIEAVARAQLAADASRTDRLIG